MILWDEDFHRTFIKKSYGFLDKLGDPLSYIYILQDHWYIYIVVLFNSTDDRLCKSAIVVHTLLFIYAQHKTEVDIVKKYSPFKTDAEIFEQFDKITTSTGKKHYLHCLSCYITNENICVADTLPVAV